MKKLISLLFCVLIAINAFVPCFASDGAITPRIIETVYPTDDVVIADIVINADRSGETDVTSIIQQAIDDCAANGGGTVWLPEGKYRITGSLYIRQFVTLMGDYQDPDEGKQYGTIIVADVESTDAMNPALIKVGASAGAIGLTVWYPEQEIDAVKPYPFTFYVVGNEDYMLSTIKNCTLINSYRGIGASAECENGIYECHEMLTIENVKGTCLYQGLNAHNSADVDTVKTLYISNEYWAEAGAEFNSPERRKIDDYTRKNAFGLIIGDLEWPEFANVRVSDMLYGIFVKEGTRYTFSGEFTDLYITDCDYGIYIPEHNIIQRGYSWGTGISNGVIKGSKYAIYDPGKNATVLTNVEIEGKVKGKNIRIYNADTSKYTPDYEHTHAKPNDILYVVSADKTAKSDASAAVQAKLDEAAVTGGVVYLPAGVYRFENPITVPAAVEFRGSSSVATRCQRDNSSGTLILSYYGYDPSSKPLITLGGDSSGISGIRVDYPLNNPVDESGNYMKTSPVIYSEFNDVYAVNCCITLASCGIKLENSDNAFMKKIIGCCYESMFSLTECDGAFIEGCLQNANTLPRNGYAKLGIPRLTEDKLFDYVFIPITRIQTDYIRLNSCKDATVFNTFIYGGKSFLNSVNSNAVFVNVGHDGSSKTEPALIMSGGEITFLNSMRSTSDGQHGFNFYSIENGTSFKSYNSQSVDMDYSEHPVIRNIKFNELDKGERIYYFLQPFYKLIAFFGKLRMENK
ncbi:MAG: hypothetical protein IJE74_08205 [Clostridia bacterium]|nr:hypothetical protein [Clostridia bacterium]